MILRIVLDVSAFLACLRAAPSADTVLRRLGRGAFDPCVSAPLVHEYEHAARRAASTLDVTHVQIDDVLNFLCAQSHHVSLSRLWRPILADPLQDLVLATAAEAECDFVIAQRFLDFTRARSLGIRVANPDHFLTIERARGTAAPALRRHP